MLSNTLSFLSLLYPIAINQYCCCLDNWFTMQSLWHCLLRCLVVCGKTALRPRSMRAHVVAVNFPRDTTNTHIHVSLAVVSASRGACTGPIRVQARAPNDSGFLSTTLAEQQRVGTGICPWEIVASPGQRISLTVFSFIDHAPDTLPGSCVKVGH